MNEKHSVESFAKEFSVYIVDNNHCTIGAINVIKKYKDVLPKDLAFEFLSALTNKLKTTEP